MAEVTISLKRVTSEDEARGVCGAAFIPAEDSGSRTFTIATGKQDFVSLMWRDAIRSGRTATVRIRSKLSRGASPLGLPYTLARLTVTPRQSSSGGPPPPALATSC